MKNIKLLFLLVGLFSIVTTVLAQRSKTAETYTLANVENMARGEESGGTRCIGAADCGNSALTGFCNVQSTNNAAIVSCDHIYVVTNGDCCGIQNVVQW